MKIIKIEIEIVIKITVMKNLKRNLQWKKIIKRLIIQKKEMIHKALAINNHINKLVEYFQRKVIQERIYNLESSLIKPNKDNRIKKDIQPIIL